MNSNKTTLIVTIVLAITAVVTAGFAAYGISTTVRTVEATEEMLKVTKEMLEVNLRTAEVNNETLQVSLLSERYQALKESLEVHRKERDIAFREYIYYIAEETPGAPTGWELVNDESLCSTLGSMEYVCTTYHEYDEIFMESMVIPYEILRSLQVRDLESAAAQLDLLEANLLAMHRLYLDVFAPGSLRDW